MQTVSCALTFTHSVSLKGGHPTAEETRTGPIAVLVHSYLMQFEIQTAPGCQKILNRNFTQQNHYFKY